MFAILARVWARSVRMPASAPVREMAFPPRALMAMAVSATEGEKSRRMVSLMLPGCQLAKAFGVNSRRLSETSREDWLEPARPRAAEGGDASACGARARRLQS